MWRLILFVLIYLLQNATSYNQGSLCGSDGHKIGSCSSLILGQNHSDADACTIEYIQKDSPVCKAMYFSPIESNPHLGKITLKAHSKTQERQDDSTMYKINNTVINVTFTDIKWKSMTFRFQLNSSKRLKNQCNNIVISNNVSVDAHTELYYDCYSDVTEKNYVGLSHMIDFEATDDVVVHRGQYYFNMPSPDILNPTVTEKEWKPFIYLELLETSIKLHMTPPPAHLKIPAYHVRMMKECDKGTVCEAVRNNTLKLKNNTDEVTYDYGLLRNSGAYYFLVTPLHEKCNGVVKECQTVKSPVIQISNEHQTLNICIASITALVVATLFAYYIILRVLRRYWCKDYSPAFSHEIPLPTKVLVIYSPTVKLHAECVASFVSYLRSEFGFDMMYEGDISSTSHEDPFTWANEAFRIATHVMYIVGPSENNHIYDKTIPTAYKNVDKLLLSLVQANRISKCPKDVSNVFFEHSNGEIPMETRHDKMFFLLKDWNKLIAFLSKNLLPKQQIMRTEKGRCFFEDLKRAKKLLSKNGDVVVIDKMNFEKKVLL